MLSDETVAQRLASASRGARTRHTRRTPAGIIEHKSQCLSVVAACLLVGGTNALTPTSTVGPGPRAAPGRTPVCDYGIASAGVLFVKSASVRGPRPQDGRSAAVYFLG